MEINNDESWANFITFPKLPVEEISPPKKNASRFRFRKKKTNRNPGTPKLNIWTTQKYHPNTPVHLRRYSPGCIGCSLSQWLNWLNFLGSHAMFSRKNKYSRLNGFISGSIIGWVRVFLGYITVFLIGPDGSHGSGLKPTLPTNSQVGLENWRSWAVASASTALADAERS